MKTHIDRRTFLKLASFIGMSFFSSALYANSLSRKQIPQQSDRIDVHHHILSPVYTSALAKIGITSGGGVAFPDWNAQTSLDIMERNKIVAAITSISSPGIYFGDIKFTKDLAKQCNEFSVSLVRDHPKRFGGFAVLPLPDVKAALRKLEYALDSLKPDGVFLLSNVDGYYPPV